MPPDAVLPLPPLDPADAPAQARDLMLRGKRLAGGMLPNMYRHMAHAPAMFETYLDGYERFRAGSGFTPAEQEVIFLVISAENACEYCVAAHSLVADLRSGVPLDVTAAIREGHTIRDERFSVLAEFTRTLLLSRGRPPQDDVDAFLAVGFTPPQVLELVHAIALKTISNYANHLMATPLDGLFRSREWRAYRVGTQAVQFARRVFGR